MIAIKHDFGKPRLELVPPELMVATGEAPAFGAARYGDRNWEQGLEWGRVYDALQRHLNAWWNGEDYDSGSGRSHPAHASCCVAFLLAYEARGVGEDDRPSKSAEKIEPDERKCR